MLTVGGIIIKLLIGAIVLGAVGVWFFTWLNTKDSRLDHRSYDDDFQAGDMFHDYKVHGRQPEDNVDPAAELRDYQVKHTPTKKN
jgi:hypothetical protein